MIAKYFATSLATEKVVRAPRVISICLPIDTRSMSFVGSESRSIRLAASLAVVGTVAGHRHEPALGLLAADQAELFLRLCLGDEIVDPGLRGHRQGGDRIVAGDHDGADSHLAQPRDAFAHAGFWDIRQCDHA